MTASREICYKISQDNEFVGQVDTVCTLIMDTPCNDNIHYTDNLICAKALHKRSFSVNFYSKFVYICIVIV